MRIGLPHKGKECCGNEFNPAILQPDAILPTTITYLFHSTPHLIPYCKKPLHDIMAIAHFGFCAKDIMQSSI